MRHKMGKECHGLFWDTSSQRNIHCPVIFMGQTRKVWVTLYCKYLPSAVSSLTYLSPVYPNQSRWDCDQQPESLQHVRKASIVMFGNTKGRSSHLSPKDENKTLARVFSAISATVSLCLTTARSNPCCPWRRDSHLKIQGTGNSKASASSWKSIIPQKNSSYCFW